MNLMSNDAQKFFDVMQTIQMIWAAPLQMVLASGLLIYLFGW